jgi:starch phosphorylase
VLKANPGLSQLLNRTIGEEWITDFDQIHRFEPASEDAGLRAEFREIKRDNKQRLAKVIAQTTGVLVDPESMFDVHIKRFHEYKRQLLNLLRITCDYLRITEDGETLTTPATYIFAGKSAPAYLAATQIIKLINNVARTRSRSLSFLTIACPWQRSSFLRPTSASRSPPQAWKLPARAT